MILELVEKFVGRKLQLTSRVSWNWPWLLHRTSSCLRRNENIWGSQMSRSLVKWFQDVNCRWHDIAPTSWKLSPPLTRSECINVPLALTLASFTICTRTFCSRLENKYQVGAREILFFKYSSKYCPFNWIFSRFIRIIDLKI